MATLPKDFLYLISCIALLQPMAWGQLGNVWHIPGNTENGIPATMRNPLYEAKNMDMVIYQGFWKNGGANGDQNGGSLKYCVVPRGGAAGDWQTVELEWHADVPENGNQYWKATLPSQGIAATDVIEYYVVVTFNASHNPTPVTTYIYGKDLGSSLTTADENVAQNAPFSIRNRPGWIYHGNNRIVAGDDLQVRVKTGYIGPDNDPATRWSTAGALYYTTDGTDPAGALGLGTGSTTAVALVFDGTEGDNSGNGNALWWRGTMAGVLNGLPLGGQVRYKIGLWNAETNEEKFADHSAAVDNQVFVYQNGVLGEPTLTVNGLSANYTTSKLFVDEIAGDSIPLEILFAPGEANIVAAEVYTNLNRRDRAEVDANNDGYPDGISGLDGNSLVAGNDDHYYKAYAMTLVSPGQYSLTLPANRTGAYRLTARWKVDGDPAWRWYTNGDANRRDHAITVSPTDARDIVLYEVNVLNIEASGDQFGQRSTIEDMHNADGAPHNANNRWDLDYLTALGANWLWFQPIHPAGYDGREPSGGYDTATPLYDPGSPYAVKNFFEVNPIMSKEFIGDPMNVADTMDASNREAAMTAWRNFVQAADSKKVGIMLDAPFNHTSFDVELAEIGVELFQPDGATWSATDEIRNREARFFSKVDNYDQRASGAWDIAAGPDRFDFGKWRDVKDVFFGVYAALVPNAGNSGNYLNEGDWFDATHPTWTANDFNQDGQPVNVTRRVWQYFAHYAVHWLDQTRPAGQNRNSETEAGLTLQQRYEWDARGIDGLRCDFGQGLPPQAWEYMINVARTRKWNFVMMSESLDGGAVTYRSNRHFDILNENIVFPLKSASTKWDYRNIFEDRRNAYGLGLVLTNTTSHDEENYEDPWQAVVRFGVTASLDGAPMIFPGQELGISRTFGYDHYEFNFGKQIAHFKRYNSMMPIWNNTDYGNDQLYHVYAGMAQARQFSPALRSANRWFLDGDGNNPAIHAVAKFDQDGASPAFSDVVLAFANLNRSASSADNFKIPGGLATKLGLEDDRIYHVRNIAAYLGTTPGRRDSYLWENPISGADLKANGFLVDLNPVPATVEAWTTAPFEAQYLKVYDVTPPPAPASVNAPAWSVGTALPLDINTSSYGAHDNVVSYTLTVLNASNQPIHSETISGFDAVTLPVNPDWYGQTVTVQTTPVSSAGIQGTPSTTAPVLLLDPAGDHDDDGMSNADEVTAGTNPTDADEVFALDTIEVGAAASVSFNTRPGRRYQLQYSEDFLQGANPPTWLNVPAPEGVFAETGVNPGTGQLSDPSASTSRIYKILVEIHP